jgi:cytidylate kinase
MAVVTISRQYGSGGDEIATRVAEMLGYRLFDKGMMAQVASEVGLSEHEVVDFSETDYKARSFLNRLFSLFETRPGEGRAVGETASWRRDTTGARIRAVERLDEERSIAMVSGTIQAAYKRGNVVIVGRGGQVVLKEMPDVLHVRIQAPLGARVQRVQDQENVSLQEAQEVVSERDKASAAYLRRFYDVDWSDPVPYDLVVNTGKWDVEAAAHIIVNAVSYLPAAGSSG